MLSVTPAPIRNGLDVLGAKDGEDVLTKLPFLYPANAVPLYYTMKTHSFKVIVDKLVLPQAEPVPTHGLHVLLGSLYNINPVGKPRNVKGDW